MWSLFGVSIFLAAFAAFTAVIYTFHNLNSEAHNIKEGDDGSDSIRYLSELWAIPKPSIECHSLDGLVCILKYDKSDRMDFQNYNYDIVSSSVSLWSKECRSGGGTRIRLQNDNAMTIEQGSDYSITKVKIVLNDQELVSVLDDGKIASGSIAFCVRYALGTTTRDDVAPLEVNYHESVVRATLIAGQTYQVNGRGKSDGKINKSIPSFEVMEATATSLSEQLGWRHESTFLHNFTIQAFFCRGSNDNSPITRSLHQGSVVTICVQPSRNDWSIRVASIEEFTWTKVRTKNPQSTVAEHHVNNAHVIARQKAINGGIASDMFTVYEGCGDGKNYFCAFSTLLEPAFYTGDGMVSGSGTVFLAFGTARRRGQNNGN